MPNETVEDLLAQFSRKYLWWKPIDGQPFPEVRIIAQTMNLGTYEDIRRLEAAVGRQRLAEVMLKAEPGWFDDRSWGFWRGRLAFNIGAVIPEEAPRRAFHHATS